jgi:hypothetical protein
MAWIRSQTSSGRPPGAIVASMNRPMISPSDVLISSPTIASSGASRRRASAPSAVLWSVSAMRSSRSSAARAMSASRLVPLSGE